MIQNTLRCAALAAMVALTGCATRELRDFTTDGCSLFPDGAWCECCVAHDQTYWRGGTAAQRQRADAAMRECVANTGRPALAGWMYYGVRLGGTPLLPTWFRWGYGWGYGRGYKPLTPEEQAQADGKLKAYRPSQPVCEPAQ